MIITILKEQEKNEKRVAITPDNVKRFKDMGFTVHIQENAGKNAGFIDEEYKTQGATINKTPDTTKTSLLLCVNIPDEKTIASLPKGCFVIGLLDPHKNKEILSSTKNKDIRFISLELLPRITRAQNMDVLSSQANLAGYRAVIEGCHAFNHALPLMMTAAGTVPAAKVLVLGAGVAGLQAIATAKRLGAIVIGYDVRAAVKEQVESLGATFLEVSTEEKGDAKGGYAKEMSTDYQKKQEEKLSEVLPKIDIVITTAQIPGKPAPVLLTKSMVEKMKPGSVIVDMSCASGGNCCESKPDQIVEHKGVSIVGYTNLASRIAFNASQLYSKNILNFVKGLLFIEKETLNAHWDDELLKATLISKQENTSEKKSDEKEKITKPKNETSTTKKKPTKKEA